MAATASIAVPLGAQVVRGTVTQTTARAPIVGAVVELLRVDGAEQRVATALTDLSGGYALRAPASGNFRLVAKRIGVRRYVSEPFPLATGETRTIDVSLDPVEYRLPTVVVTANALCSVEPRDANRVGALWEEARTALQAAEISLRDKLFTAHVTRYVRELDPRTRRILNETRSEVRGIVESPISVVPPETLSVGGYWRDGGGGRTLYYGPDTRVLLSESFVDDHCFRPVSGKGARARLVGLEFTPVANRPVPEVRGTIWLDARTFELQLVKFGYDRVREGVDIDAVGGEVHFARLANGAWIVRRWSLRVPLLGRPQNPVATDGSAPWVLVRPLVVGLSEEGGEVTPDEMRAALGPASLGGTVRDSGGKGPLAHATVRIGGTSRTTVTDADGQFKVDSVAAGALTLLVTAPGYDNFGLVAANLSLQLEPGEMRRVTLRGDDTWALATRLCHGRGVPFGRATLHLTVTDSASGEPLEGVRGRVEWMSTIGQVAGDSTLARIEAHGDARGMITFCEVPAERAFTVRLEHPDAAAGTPLHIRLHGRELRHVEVRLARRPPTE